MPPTSAFVRRCVRN